MVSTTSKEVSLKIQAHVKNCMKGMGGVSSLFKTMDSLMVRRPGYEYSVTPYAAAYKCVEGGLFLAYNTDIIAELHRWGLTDDKRINNYRALNGNVGPFDLYAHLMAREIAKMYEQAKKPKKVVKKAVRKTTARRN